MSSSKAAASGHWSDGETSALVKAWGQLQQRRNRGFLGVREWRQVCDAVNAHRADAGRRSNRSVDQCKCRISWLKSQYKKEVAKGQSTSEWRHFAQLRDAFLASGPPPGFAANVPLAPASVKEEDMAEGVEELATATAKEEEKEVGREGPASSGVATEPAEVVTKLAEVYERVEMEKMAIEREKMAMEMERRNEGTSNQR